MANQDNSGGQNLLSGGLYSPLAAFGAGLLANSGWSTIPISTGQALGAGYQNMVAQHQLAQQDRLQKIRESIAQSELAKMQRAQTQQAQADLARQRFSQVLGTSGVTQSVQPGSAQEFQQFNNPNFTPDVNTPTVSTPGTGYLGGQLSAPQMRAAALRYQAATNPDAAANAILNPKVDKLPNGVQEYQFARNQGYPGTYQQWVIDRAHAGATSVNVNPADRYLGVQNALKMTNEQGDHPNPGMTPQQALDAGFKLANTQAQNTQLSARGAFATLDRLKQLVNNVGIWQPGHTDNRFLNDISAGWNRVTQSDKNQVLYEAFSQGTLAPLIRAVGEKGNLANEDIARALKLVPSTGDGLMSLPDTRDVAQQKIQQLKAWFDQAMGRVSRKKDQNGPVSPANNTSQPIPPLPPGFVRTQ